ncbi:TPA: hypothetical protein ACKQC7_004874 [Serratia marcescens]
MRNNEWLQNRLDYLRGLHKHIAQQQLLMALAAQSGNKGASMSWSGLNDLLRRTAPITQET